MMIDQAAARIRAYLRVSDPRSAERGNSRAGQIEAIETHARLHIPETVSERGLVVYEDLGVSAFSTPLAQRKGGERLLAEVQPGDHVVFFRLDRAFRNLTDAVVTLSRWRDDGVRFHDTSFPGLDHPQIGQLMIAILSWAAEWESAAKSQRIKATDEFLLRTEGRRSRRPPWYLKLGTKSRNGRRRAQLDERKVELLFAMKQLREEGETYAEIARIASRRIDPSFEPTPYTAAKEWPISPGQVQRMLRPEYWERFIANPLLKKQWFEGASLWEREF